jgi:hypothetical protein
MDSFFNRYWYLAAIFLLLLIAGLTLANYYFVQQNPGGNDFLVHWVGTRALFVDGLSPYSDEVAERIQTLAYGRPAQAGEHELRVAYPLYSVLVFLPFSLISDYEIARAILMTALELALIGLGLLSLRLTRWKIGLWLLPFFLIFSILWYHSLRPLINGNAVILVALMLVGAFAALKRGRDELAGILLAASTIKPHLVLMSAGAALLVPDWPLQNLREIMAYSSYNPPGTPGAVFETWLPATGEQFGWALSVVMGLILLTEWVLVRGKDFRWFLWTASLTLVISQWIGIQTDPGNFILLYFPLVLVFALWIERWGRAGIYLVSGAMVLLFIGPWMLFLETVTDGDQPMQHPVMFFPLPLFLLITLYWVRWWGIKPRSLLVDRLREYEEQL